MIGVKMLIKWRDLILLGDSELFPVLRVPKFIPGSSSSDFACCLARWHAGVYDYENTDVNPEEGSTPWLSPVYDQF
jgi:hypothetical protein